MNSLIMNSSRESPTPSVGKKLKAKASSGCPILSMIFVFGLGIFLILIVPSFSRPRISDDNPFSEALFRTVKYSPIYPEKPFETLEAARKWMCEFVKWYNFKHLHSGIKFVTPVQRHTEVDEIILKYRDEVYKKAKNKNPHRWSKNTRNWNKDKEVLLNPEKCKTVNNQLNVAV